MRRLAAFREYLKERLEDARPAEAPEPLPYAVPVAKLVGQGSPGDTVDREIVDRLQEFSVIMSRFLPGSTALCRTLQVRSANLAPSFL